jgi:phage shock protein A
MTAPATPSLMSRLRRPFLRVLAPEALVGFDAAPANAERLAALDSTCAKLEAMCAKLSADCAALRTENAALQARLNQTQAHLEQATAPVPSLADGAAALAQRLTQLERAMGLGDGAASAAMADPLDRRLDQLEARMMAYLEGPFLDRARADAARR